MFNRKVDPAKRNERLLQELLKIESNKYCADCGQKGTCWASWNIGVFLCIRCGGLHRSLGTHISRVKSVRLDEWTDEQIESISAKGNAKVNQLYNPYPDRHPFPTFSGDMENYIRDKYERRLFMDSTEQESVMDSRPGPMVLNKKRSSVTSPRATSANLLDDQEFRSSGSADSHMYTKQLDLLAEMGFQDREFNLKTLKAANGNMQDALEIIVAANQKLRNKQSPSATTITTTNKPQSVNILDDLDFITSAASTTATTTITNIPSDWPEEKEIETQFASVSIDSPWAEVEQEKVAVVEVQEEKKHEEFLQQSEHEVPTEVPEVHEAPSDDNDPLTFNPFKSTHTTTPYSDDLFANPW